jgi:hypothetical protein
LWASGRWPPPARRCSAEHAQNRPPAAPPLRTELPAERVSARAAWTGVGDVDRDRLDLRDRGYSFHASGTEHLAARDADVTAVVLSALEQHLTGPSDSVLSRSSDSRTTWERS